MGKSDFDSDRSRSREKSRSAPSSRIGRKNPPPPPMLKGGKTDMFSAGKKFNHNPDHPLYKTQLCRESLISKAFEQRGSCNYEGKCNFAHGKGELRMGGPPRKRPGSRTRSRSRSRDSRYSRSYSKKGHTRSRSRSRPRCAASKHPMYKTSICFEYQNTGRCNNGSQCRFAHGKLDLRVQGRPDRYQYPDPDYNRSRSRSRRRSRSPSSRSRSRSRSRSGGSSSPGAKGTPRRLARRSRKRKKRKRKKSRSEPSSSDEESESSSSSESATPAEKKMDTQQALLAVQSYEAQVQMACLQGGVPLQHPQIQAYLLQLQQIQLAAQSAMLIEQSKKAGGAKKKKRKKKKKKKKG